MRLSSVSQLEQDEAVPADLLLLSAQTHPDVTNTLNMAGTASVDTAQLDGETNLKLKRGMARAFSSAVWRQASVPKDRSSCWYTC